MNNSEFRVCGGVVLFNNGAVDGAKKNKYCGKKMSFEERFECLENTDPSKSLKKRVKVHQQTDSFSFSPLNNKEPDLL